jgi:hypothetical protein
MFTDVYPSAAIGVAFPSNRGFRRQVFVGGVKEKPLFAKPWLLRIPLNMI